MDPGSTKTLLPAPFLAAAIGLTGLLAVLLATSPGPDADAAAAAAARADEEERSVPPVLIPWAPLSEPPAELAPLAAVRAAIPAKMRVEALVDVYQNELQPARLRGLAAFAAGVHELDRDRHREALRHFQTPAIDSTALSGYALFYRARAHAASDAERALAALEQLERRDGDLAIDDEARLLHASTLSELGRREEAVARLLPVTASTDEKRRGEALDEIGKLYTDLGGFEEAVAALEALYYGLPRHPRAAQAGGRLTRLRGKLPEPDPAHLYRIALERAERLREAGRAGDAHQAFASLLRRFPDVADEQLVWLRLAESEYRRRRLTASVRSFGRVTRDDLAPEALYYLSEVSRRLRRSTEYQERAAELLTRFPKSPWAEQALFHLARHHESEDQRHVALGYYNQLLRAFSRGERYLEARWRLAWDKYRAGRYEEAGFELEETARQLPGADAGARLLYWAGRSYEEAARFDRAEELFRRVLLGYQNTYYGRLAFEHLSRMNGQRASLAAIEKARRGIDLGDALRVERVGVQRRIAELYAVGLSARALAEAERAASSSRRDDAAFRAVAAWIHAAENRSLEAIITLRDAFPFHASATGDLLPRDVWRLLYPMRFKEHVEHYAAARGLDPYLVAALIRQESTFNPRVRSRANARGLMQILPSTGRSLARRERRPYRLSDLYDPEINIRYGTRYLKEVLDRFQGRVDYALASYNAGPHRVRRWTEMDMSLDPEVFIEEIPFDETRGYVKLVLRNEMLYRRLYGDAPASADE